MVKFLTFTGASAGRFFVLAVLTTTLAACGGSSGGTADTDGENIDDIVGRQDLDMDGFINREDSDADGDGLDDLEVDVVTGVRADMFFDLDGDGFDDLGSDANDPSTACGAVSGSDAYSANSTWDDNCEISRSIVVGPFADSLYSVGIQRITWCAGFGALADGADPVAALAGFADGEFGPNAEAALQAFQSATQIDVVTLEAGDAPFAQVPDDGRVGPRTWAKLRKALTRLSQDRFNDDNTVQPASYGFTRGRCANIPLFYQRLALDPVDERSIIPGGWRLSRNAPNEIESVPFSIDLPFNLP